MSVQQFCLRWNNHQPNFISVCSSLLHNGTLVDVTLAAEGRQLQAHKIVLSACSSYFQSLFTSNPCQHPIVILKDVQYNDLKTMVDFMYYGEVNVSQEQLPHILKTAEMLKIKGLAEMPDAAASLTKSDSKSSDQTEQHQGGGGGGTGSGSESLWGSTESQFQHHHHTHQHQQNQSHHQQQQRTPSPQMTGTSPSAARRKRLRKSSNSGSGERTSEEQSSVEGGGGGGTSSSNINISHMSQISFGNNTNLTSTIHPKIIKESSSTDTEIHPHDSSQESIEDTSNPQQHHHVQQIKPETDISGVPQSIPLDISGPGTPSEHDTSTVPQSQSSHSDNPTIPPSTIGKRSRFLIRQPRIKRDSDTTGSQQSPEVIEFDPISSSSSRSFLTVPPPKIERHASEPAPSTESTSSSHLLSVPQSTHFLMKQHSHPLLPSQSSLSSSPPPSTHFTLHRQLSHPIPSSSTITISEPMLSSIGASSSTCVLTTSSALTESTTSSMVHHFTTSSSIKQESITPIKINEGQSPSVILVSDPLTALPTATAAIATSSGIEHHNIPSIRVKSEELHRSASSPQAIREISLENPRSSHCPVIRPGPALGCNFCWNTIDAHGRILRRKTKYHCPECQTNLCIVPCFQEYHERQLNENPSNETTSNNPLAANRSKSLTSPSSAGLSHYSKTGSM